MTFLGSNGPRGDTAEEMCKALAGRGINLPCRYDDPKFIQSITKLSNFSSSPYFESTSDDESFSLQNSNAIFIAKSQLIEEKFANFFTHFEHDRVMRTEFDSMQAYRDMNEWMNETTNGLVPRYFKSPNEISPNTLMVILNTLGLSGKALLNSCLCIFLDNWLVPFDKTETKTGIFRLSTKEAIEVPMMSVIEELCFVHVKNYKIYMKPLKVTKITGSLQLTLKQIINFRLVYCYLQFLYLTRHSISTQ